MREKHVDTAVFAQLKFYQILISLRPARHYWIGNLCWLMDLSRRVKLTPAQNKNQPKLLYSYLQIKKTQKLYPYFYGYKSS